MMPDEKAKQRKMVQNLRRDAERFRSIANKFPNTGKIENAAERLEKLVDRLEKGDEDDA
jgi:hypothetical protein